jgi:hypothetical protein
MLFHFSQQNTLLSVPSYNTEITQHKHTIPIQTKSSNANNWKGLIYLFNFLMTTMVRKIWQEACGLQGMVLRVLMARSND